MTCVWIGLAGIVLYNRRRLIGSTIRSCQVQNSLFRRRERQVRRFCWNLKAGSLMFDLWRPGSQLMLILIDTHGYLWYIALKGILTSLLHYWLDDTSATVKGNDLTSKLVANYKMCQIHISSIYIVTSCSISYIVYCDILKYILWYIVIWSSETKKHIT